MRINKYSKYYVDWYSFFGVGFLISVTANPFFYETIHPIIFGGLFYGFQFLSSGKKIDNKFIYLILFVSVIFLGQYLTTGNFRILTFFGVLLRFSLAYFIIKTISSNFFISAANFITITAYISLTIYIPLIFFPGLADILINNFSDFLQAPFHDEFREHIIFFDFSSRSLSRFSDFPLNSGYYWEPGANAIFLNFALAIYLFIERKILTLRNMILIFCILTTFSTTGYISFSVLILSYFGFTYRNNFTLPVFFIIIPILSVLFFYTFQNLPFLQTKLQETILETYSTTNTGSRFQSFVLDYDVWKEKPFFGKDIYLDEYGNELEKSYALHRNNGLGRLLASYGIFSFLLYIFFVYGSVNHFNKHYVNNKYFGSIFMILFLISAFGMPMILRPFYYGILVLGIVKKTN